MDITYIDRKTGQKCIEKVYGRFFLSLLYGDGFFRSLVSKIILPILSCVPFFSWMYGLIQKSSWSQKKVAPFIEAYGVDQTEFETTEFFSFNDFFIRKLKPEVRPVVQDPKIVVAPADGRYLVFPKFSQFVVKGQEFCIRKFLGQGPLARRYMEGSMAIIRLCPTDYHRFHFPCDGVASKPEFINGPLYSVNPIALKKRLAILSENKRAMTEIETSHFGTVLYVEIGATFVGSIKQTYQYGSFVRKGEEKGYFEFGGSCIVLLFEKGQITFDSDLVANSANGLETKLNFGQSLGAVIPKLAQESAFWRD